ncbi:MAG TPA: glycerophosphodiester phosphodiesterase, partial [Gemmatimonadaceae bacterium]|nr:glycerophosphodiester phosphodiesterase [Gemmatimonadaceae bacterium]
FMRALELGANAIELDVHATRDGIVVVHHDALINAEGVPQLASRAIADFTASELHRFPLADGVPIPTLNEVLEAVGSGPMVYVEIKGENIEPLVVRCVRESPANCAIHSFDHRIVLTVKKLFPAIRTGVLEVARHVDPFAALARTGAHDLWQDVSFVDEALVARIHDEGGRVIAWTSNDPTQWKTLRSIGVDGICTDRISELATFDW